MKNTKIELYRSNTDYAIGEYQPTGVYDTIGNILKAVDQAGSWFDYINEAEQITAADGLYSIAEELDIDTTNYELFDELKEAITAELEQEELKELKDLINKMYDETPSEEKEFEEHQATKIYNYEKALRVDILANLLDLEEFMKQPDESYYEWANRLSESSDYVDRITGNGSGTYTFNTVKAAEYLVGNDGLAKEAFEEFGYPEDPSKLLDPEYVDCTIRTYLMGGVLNDIIFELEAGLINE